MPEENNNGNSAMLISLKFTFGKQGGEDKQITQQICAENQASQSSLKATKRIICKEAYEPGKKLAAECRAKVMRLTTPWDIDGVYFCKAVNAERILAVRNECWPKLAEFKEQHLLGRYDEWIAKSQAELGLAFKQEEFPTREDIAGNVGWFMGVSVLSEAQAFERINSLSKDVMEELKKSENERIQRGIKSGMATAYGRLMEPLQHMVDVLSDDSKTRIHETLVENVRKIVEEIPGLNLIDDPELAQFNTQVSTMITNLDADALRGTTKEVKVLRRAVAQQAADLLATFGTMGSRRFAV